MNPIRIAVVGATGYTGSELVRLLVRHPHVKLERLISENRIGEPYSNIYPGFRGIEDRPISPLSVLTESELDLVFLALPYGVSMDVVRLYGLERFRIIDLSGDFRLRSAELYEQWYRQPHVAADYLSKAVYGLSELNGDRIRSARLVANPGCYPTSAILPLAPLLKAKLIRPQGIIIDSKSGVTGAGATAKPSTHFAEIFGNFRAYGLLSHRHTPEIEQYLADVAAEKVDVLFTPHLLPIDRGILTAAYAEAAPGVTTDQLRDALRDAYYSEPFIRLTDFPPTVKNVRGSNFCDLFVTHDPRTNRVITISVLDNLMKGASGQAVQNLNLMFDLPETSGLEHVPLTP